MRTRTSKPVELPQKIRKHYDRAQERSRLFTPASRLEFHRTKELISRDLRSGQHRNPTNHPDYFTTAFFHHPDEIRNEIREAGFEAPQLYAIEGPGWLLPNFERAWSDPVLKRRLLNIVRAVETEPALLGQSAHILAVARKK
ncbi:MAG: hypothetical protein WAM08_01915, partial [Candidatus Acidiferrales bacterium]